MVVLTKEEREVYKRITRKQYLARRDKALAYAKERYKKYPNYHADRYRELKEDANKYRQLMEAKEATQ